MIITYYWPPSGGGGVQRWLKFAKYLPEFDWEPIIFTPENPDFNIQDETLLSEVSTDLEVIRLPIWEPYQLFEKVSGKKTPAQGLITSGRKKSLLTNLALWIRGNFFIPDPRKFWIKPSVKFLNDLIRSNEIDVVITTGPPHSMHLIGLRLKKQSDIRWVADFRDPWSKWDMLDNFKLSSVARAKHKRLEKNVLKNADEVITVSETWAAEFKEIHERKYNVITNGFDEDDFRDVQRKENNEKFIISHFGLINDFRNPKALWPALKEIAAEEKIEVRLYGMIEQPIVDFIKVDEVLSDIVDLRSSISHKEVIQAYADSDLLLLLLNDSENAKGHIPGKLFEYLASDRPILAFGPTDGDAAKIINEMGAGIVVGQERTNLLEELRALMSSKGSNYNTGDKLRFSRKRLTQRLVNDILNKSSRPA